MPDVECPPIALPEVEPPAPDAVGPYPGAECPDTGTLVAIPKKHCLVLDVYGAVTGLTTEYQMYVVPACFVPYGSPFCVTDEVCCQSSWYCVEGVCTEVAFGDDPPEGAVGPFATEAECDANNVDRWYCVDGVCTEVLACEAPPEGAAGPFADEAACEAGGCEDTDTVVTTCCPAPIPVTLWLTIGGVGSFLSVYDGAGNWDTGDITIPGCGTVSVRLYCFGDIWSLNSTASADYSIGFSDYTTACDPFSVAATGVLGDSGGLPGGPCNGSVYTFTVTA